MKFSRENMNLIFQEIKTTQNFLSPSSQPPLLSSHRPNTNFDINSRISPSILLIIIILSIIFFISGLLHLLVRFLLTPSRRDRDDYFDNVTALQGQLQQLFHLHDSGVDQSFIDTLPVFHYKSIIGLKNYPFDCAVCLCEFETEDKLRLLPKCSHAFHVDCIDTWLLSHSTCPLCRSSLLVSDLSSPRQDPRSSFLLVLESSSEHSSRDIAGDRESVPCVAANDVDDDLVMSNSQMGFVERNDLGSTRFESGRVDRYTDGKLCGSVAKVVPFEVKLGKFRNMDIGEGSSSNNNNIGNSNKIDERRCISMGSYEYIMDEESSLKVHVSTKKVSSKNNGRLAGHRTAVSECGFDPTGRFKFNGNGSMRIEEEAAEKNVVGRESFSVSKIWLRGKKEKHSKIQGKEDSSLVSSSSGRVFSFGLSNQRNPLPEEKTKTGFEEDNQKSENSESLETKTPSFARRTMLWLAGRQNKVVHSSSSNV